MNFSQLGSIASLVDPLSHSLFVKSTLPLLRVRKKNVASKLKARVGMENELDAFCRRPSVDGL